MSYVLSLDVGTSSTRAALYDRTGAAVPGLCVDLEHEPEYTPDGGEEMDAEALLQRTLRCIDGVLRLAGPRGKQIVGVGMSTFWHSILGVGADGGPVSPVILWGDTRSVREVSELKRLLDEDAVHARTGCVQHTSYVPGKLLWIARNRPEWLRAARSWMSPGEYFLQRLTGRTGCSFSMASGTGLLDQERLAWDSEVLDVLPITAEQLSPLVDVHASVQGLVPEFSTRFPQLKAVPWLPAAGDGACSNLGSGCTGPERMALTVGTSGALRVLGSCEHAAEPAPPAGLWKYRVDRRRYLLGGALSNGGNLFAWLRETLRVAEGSDLQQAVAALEPDSHGLTLLPFLAGERSPGWHGEARAAIVGLSLSTRPEQIVRAGLEAVALRFALLHAQLRTFGAADHEIIASGGALLGDPAWCQIMADALGHSLVVSPEHEASARGAALLALEAAGLLRDAAEAQPGPGTSFTPDPEHSSRYRAARARQERLYQLLVAQDWAGPGSGSA